jgi:hypothetical protein
VQPVNPVLNTLTIHLENLDGTHQRCTTAAERVEVRQAGTSGAAEVGCRHLHVANYDRGLILPDRVGLPGQKAAATKHSVKLFSHSGRSRAPKALQAVKTGQAAADHMGP